MDMRRFGIGIIFLGLIIAAGAWAYHRSVDESKHNFNLASVMKGPPYGGLDNALKNQEFDSNKRIAVGAGIAGIIFASLGLLVLFSAKQKA